MSQVSLIKGYIFADRYEIVRRIASGGMGAVYEVTHLETNRRRALKVMHQHTFQSEELRERFRNEARVAAKIESEHIVDVFDAGVDEATRMPFLVMELLRGEDLGKLLRKRKRFEPREVHTYLRQVASALDKTHRANVVHRDLKPDNLFLTEREDGMPWIKVLDFGIAKVLAEFTAEQNQTVMVGTPIYMAPEQFQASYAVSPATDLYSLGLVAYTLLVGLPYWREESRRSERNVFLFASDAMRGPSEPATARARRAGVDLPEAFDAWFAKATAHAPRARFETAGEMVMALAVALGLAMVGSDGMTTMPLPEGTAPPEAQPPTIAPHVTTNPPSTKRGRRWMLGVGAVVGVATLGATGVLLLASAEGPQEQADEEPEQRAAATAAEAPRPPGSLVATQRPLEPPAATAEKVAAGAPIERDQKPANAITTGSQSTPAGGATNTPDQASPKEKEKDGTPLPSGRRQTAKPPDGASSAKGAQTSISPGDIPIDWE